MILVDYNQVAISNLMKEIGGRKDIEIDVPLLRHMIINTLLSYKKKFAEKYGELVVCCDNKRYWRRQQFPHYKAGRKKARQESGYDWNLIFNTLDSIKKDLDAFFPFKVMDIDLAEADDIIATLCMWSQNATPKGGELFGEPEKILILSGDHDFIQLQKFRNVTQYDPIHDKWIKPDTSAEEYLFEHIIRGDRGDGIPNVLSEDDIFVRDEPSRQKAITNKKLSEWMKDKDTLPTDPAFKMNMLRNRKLIDLSNVPLEIQNDILNTFVTQPKKDRSKLIDYFVHHNMKLMLDNVSEF